MGNTCDACKCSEDKNEFRDDPFRVSIKSSTDFASLHNKRVKPKTVNDAKSKPYSNSQLTQKHKKNIKQVIALQSYFRMFKAQESLQQLKSLRPTTGKYFIDTENRETVSMVRKGALKQSERTHRYKSGAVYNGQWLGGFRHGKGTMEWPDGAKYVGSWSYGEASGKGGKFYHTDGDVYEGEWAHNKANGFGVYLNVNGARYEGYWRDDLQHGMGVEFWADSSKYEGGYVRGRKEGYGVYIWADSSKYEGEWLDNKINGLGKYLWKDGRQFYGTWSNNNMEGHGVYIWADGRRYEGQYRNDKKDGWGNYSWSDGRHYDGWWSEGKQHGLGTYYVPQKDGNIKVKHALWEYGKRRGDWFDVQTIQQINTRQIDYTAYFKDDKSRMSVEPNASFNKPAEIDVYLNDIKRKLDVPVKQNVPLKKMLTAASDLSPTITPRGQAGFTEALNPFDSGFNKSKTRR